MNFKRCEYCQEERRPHLHLVVVTWQGDEVRSPPILSIRSGLMTVEAMRSPGDLTSHRTVSYEAGRLLTIGGGSDTLIRQVSDSNLPEATVGFNLDEFFRELGRRLDAAILAPRPPAIPPQKPLDRDLPKGYPFRRRV